MSKRFINCSACKGCHTGRGGKYGAFKPRTPTSQTVGTMLSDEDVPERDSPEYESYLVRKITEEEHRLKSLQDQRRVAEMEEQLASFMRCSKEEKDVLSKLVH